MDFIILLFVIFSIFFIWYHLNRLELYKCSYSLPGPIAWPIIGNAFWCIGSSEQLIKNYLLLAKMYKSPFSFWLGSKFLIFITKPQDLEIVLNTCVEKEESIMGFFRSIIGNGLITVQSAQWKLHRKIINPAFSQNILNTFIPTFVEHTNSLISKLNEQTKKQGFDIYKYISLNTLDFICATTMGIEVNAQKEHSEYADTLHRVLIACFTRVHNIWNRIDAIFYCTSTGKQFRKDIKMIHNFAKKVMLKKKKQIAQELHDNTSNIQFPKRKAFLEHLLELNTNGKVLNDAHVFDEINTFIAAGTDTISTVIGFVCMMLGSHQNIQREVFNEIKGILGNSNEITNNNLQKLEYLERVIKETMRLFPATPLLVRSALNPIQLETCLIPKNAAIIYPIIYIQRDPNIWKDPLLFDPNRFLPENVSKRHPYSFLPFSAGLRNCIGARYAMISMKVVLAMLIKNYIFYSECKIETLRLESTIVLRPVLGHLVRIEARN